MLAPMMKQLETDLPDVKFEVIDVEEDVVQAEQYKIRSVPTVIVLHNNEIKETIVGASPKKRYMEAITAI
jgi:thioredoxin 1